MRSFLENNCPIVILLFVPGDEWYNPTLRSVRKKAPPPFLAAGLSPLQTHG
jgi:hypothetical protein